MKELAQCVYVGATLPAAPSVQIAKSRQFSMRERKDDRERERERRNSDERITTLEVHNQNQDSR